MTVGGRRRRPLSQLSRSKRMNAIASQMFGKSDLREKMKLEDTVEQRNSNPRNDSVIGFWIIVLLKKQDFFINYPLDPNINIMIYWKKKTSIFNFIFTVVRHEDIEMRISVWFKKRQLPTVATSQ